jgi:hypothetical protein
MGPLYVAFEPPKVLSNVEAGSPGSRVTVEMVPSGNDTTERDRLRDAVDGADVAMGSAIVLDGAVIG